LKENPLEDEIFCSSFMLVHRIGFGLCPSTGSRQGTFVVFTISFYRLLVLVVAAAAAAAVQPWFGWNSLHGLTTDAKI